MTTDTAYASPADTVTFGEYEARRPSPRDGVERPMYPFLSHIGDPGVPEAARRYHLYLSYSCPWAHIAAIVLHARRLGDVIGTSYVDEERDGRGWAFRERFGPDHANGFTLLREVYEAAEPGYDGHISVPTLWDSVRRRIVSNDYATIPFDLATRFGRWADPVSPDLCPEHLREAIDATDARIAESARSGGVSAGADGARVNTLEAIDEGLAGRRYLVGEQLTISDVRLWVKLVRFPVVYGAAFALDGRTLTDYPNLWDYARDLYARPEFSRTTNLAVLDEMAARQAPEVPAGPSAGKWTRG